MIDPNEALKQAKKLIKNCSFLSFYKSKDKGLLIKCIVNKKTTMYSIGDDLDTLTAADLMRLVELANGDGNKSE